MCRGGLNNISPSRHWEILLLSCRLASVSNALGLIVRGRLCEDYSRRQLDRANRKANRAKPRVASARLISQMKVSLYLRDASASVKGCARRSPLSLSLLVRAAREAATSSPEHDEWRGVGDRAHSDRVATLLRCAIGVRRITIESHAGAAITFTIPGQLRVRLTTRRDPRGNS